MWDRDKVRKATQEYFKKNNEIYPDYRDEFDDSNFKKMADLIEKNKNEKPIDVIMDYISSFYEDYEDYYWKEEIKSIAKMANVDFDEIKDDDDFREIVNEERYYTPPYDHWLDQEVCMDLVINSGDADFDFGSNGCIPPHYNGDLDYWDNEACQAASILWFIDKQDGNREDFKKFLEWNFDDNENSVCPFKENIWENKLYNSCFDELNNCGSHMNELIFLTKMTVKEWAETVENIRNGKPITIKAGTTAGLFDEWMGGGSILELPMVKDIEVKTEEIFKFEPDAALRYNVVDVYCPTEKMWEIGRPWEPNKEKAI